MGTKIFVNLPVKNLEQSIEVFTQLGFQFNPQFTDETATCMIVSDSIFVMLLTHEKFRHSPQRQFVMPPKVLKCWCVYLRRAEKKLIKWFIRRSRRVVQPIVNLKITDSCTRMGFRI